MVEMSSISMADCKFRGQGSYPERVHPVVFLSKMLKVHCTSFLPGVYVSTGEGGVSTPNCQGDPMGN